jgi:hypothetical protein
MNASKPRMPTSQPLLRKLQTERIVLSDRVAGWLALNWVAGFIRLIVTEERAGMAGVIVTVLS